MRFAIFLVTILVASDIALACPDIDGVADLDCDGQLEIITFGDSITAGEEDNERLGYPGRLKRDFLQNANIKNFGKSGERTANGRNRAGSVFSNNSSSDYAVIMEGVNDYFQRDHSSSKTRSNLLAIVRSASNSGALPILSSLTDIRRSSQRSWVKSVNKAIRNDKRIDFYSLGQGIVSRDKLHPNGSGYQQMATLASQKLVSLGNEFRPADSDQDGIYDFAESRYGTNPIDNDTDKDGISDGAEVFVYLSNPNSIDSDGDGISDQVEISVRQTDPNSNKPKPPTITEITAIP